MQSEGEITISPTPGEIQGPFKPIFLPRSMAASRDSRAGEKAWTAGETSSSWSQSTYVPFHLHSGPPSPVQEVHCTFAQPPSVLGFGGASEWGLAAELPAARRLHCTRLLAPLLGFRVPRRLREVKEPALCKVPPQLLAPQHPDSRWKSANCRARGESGGWNLRTRPRETPMAFRET